MLVECCLRNVQTSSLHHVYNLVVDPAIVFLRDARSICTLLNYCVYHNNIVNMWFGVHTPRGGGESSSPCHNLTWWSKDSFHASGCDKEINMQCFMQP